MKSPEQKVNKQINQSYMEAMITAATISYHNSGLNWEDALDKAFTEHSDNLICRMIYAMFDITEKDYKENLLRIIIN